MRTFTAFALAGALSATSALAQTTPDCAPVVAAVSSVEGYEVTIPPAAPDGAWCVLDGTRLRSTVAGLPDLAMDRVRLRHTGTEIELDLQGLRAAPRPSDRETDDRLRSLMRLQSADLRLRAVHDPGAGVVSLSAGRLELSGGTAVELDADIRAAGLDPAMLALGAVTSARLVWRNDGKLPRPLLDLAGEGLAGAPGEAAVDASREALAGLVAALPASVVDDASRKALEAAVRALPQGRGKLTLTFRSDGGVGAARLARVSLARNVTPAEMLATVLSDASIVADWQPGLLP